MPDLAVGSIQQSLLSEAQFQAVMGTTNWVLANGQGVSGSQYNNITGNSNVPDFRGCFIRMTGGEAKPLGILQYDAANLSNLSIETQVGGTTVSTGGVSVSTSGNCNQLNNKGGTKSTTPNSSANIQKNSLTTVSGNLPILVAGGSNNGTYTVTGNATSSHSHPSLNLSGTFSMSGTVPTTNRTTATTNRYGEVIGYDYETRPVNIAVNYFIKIN